MNLAAIKISQRDVINTKNSNKDASWHLMGLRYVQDSVNYASWVFANNPYSRPILYVLLLPHTDEDPEAQELENLG